MPLNCKQCLLKTESGHFPLYLFDVIGSTNSEAKAILSSGTQPGFCILADRQTAGRGRRGRSFYSPPDSGFYYTLTLPANTKIDTVFLTSAVAVAVSNAVKTLYGISLGIKWVNDLFLSGKKVAGILCEAVNSPMQDRIFAYIIGVGINLYTSEFPEDIKATAGSLCLSSPDKKKLAEEITSEILSCLSPEKHEEVLEKYTSRSIVLGKRVLFFSAASQNEGTAIKIGTSGELYVRLDNGETVCLSTGEISLRLDS